MRDSGTRVLTKLGHDLETARKALGLSQKQVAKRARFSPQTWTNTVLGGTMLRLDGVSRIRPHRPSDDTVAAAAQAVGLDVDYALTLPREAVTEQPQSVGVDLRLVPTDALLRELLRRSA